MTKRRRRTLSSAPPVFFDLISRSGAGARLTSGWSTASCVTIPTPGGTLLMRWVNRLERSRGLPLEDCLFEALARVLAAVDLAGDPCWPITSSQPAIARSAGSGIWQMTSRVSRNRLTKRCSSKMRAIQANALAWSVTVRSANSLPSA